MAIRKIPTISIKLVSLFVNKENYFFSVFNVNAEKPIPQL